MPYRLSAKDDRRLCPYRLWIACLPTRSAPIKTPIASGRMTRRVAIASRMATIGGSRLSGPNCIYFFAAAVPNDGRHQEAFVIVRRRIAERLFVAQPSNFDVVPPAIVNIQCRSHGFDICRCPARTTAGQNPRMLSSWVRTLDTSSVDSSSRASSARSRTSIIRE